MIRKISLIGLISLVFGTITLAQVPDVSSSPITGVNPAAGLGLTIEFDGNIADPEVAPSAISISGYTGGISIFYSAGNADEVTLTLAGALSYETTYTVSLTVLELGTTTPTATRTYSFTTEDRVTPEISLTSGSTGLIIHDPIILESTTEIVEVGGDPISPADLQSLVVLREDDVNGANVDFTATLEANNTTITITPDPYFDFGATYYVSLNQVQDETTAGLSVVANFNATVTMVAGAPSITPVAMGEWCVDPENNLILDDITISEGYSGNFIDTTGPIDYIEFDLPDNYEFAGTGSCDANNCGSGGQDAVGTVTNLSSSKDITGPFFITLLSDRSKIRVRIPVGTAMAHEDVFSISGLEVKYVGTGTADYGVEQSILVTTYELGYTGIPIGTTVATFTPKGTPTLSVFIDETTTDVFGDEVIGGVLDRGSGNLELCVDGVEDNDITGEFDYQVTYGGTDPAAINVVRQRTGVDNVTYSAAYVTDETIYSRSFSANEFMTDDMLYVTSDATADYCAATTITSDVKTIEQVAILTDNISYEVGGEPVEARGIKSFAEGVYALQAIYEGNEIDGVFNSFNTGIAEEGDVEGKYFWDSDNGTLGSTYYIEFLQQCRIEGDYKTYFGVKTENTEGSEQLSSAAITNGVVCRGFAEDTPISWVPSESVSVSGLLTLDGIECVGCPPDVITFEALGDIRTYSINPSKLESNDAIRIQISYSSTVTETHTVVETDSDGNITSTTTTTMQNTTPQDPIFQTLAVQGTPVFDVLIVGNEEELVTDSTYSYCEGDDEIDLYIPSSGIASYEIKRITDEDYTTLFSTSLSFNGVVVDGDVVNLASGSLASGNTYNLAVTFTNANNCDATKIFEIVVLSAPAVPSSFASFSDRDFDGTTVDIIELEYCVGEGGGTILPTIAIDTIATVADDLSLNWLDAVGDTKLFTGWSFESGISNRLTSNNIFQVQLSNSAGCISESSTITVEVSETTMDEPDPLYELIRGGDDDNSPIELLYCIGEGGGDMLSTVAIEPIGAYGLKWFDATDDTELFTGWSYEEPLISNTDEATTTFDVYTTNAKGCFSDISKVSVIVTNDYIEGKTPDSLATINMEYCVGEGVNGIIPDLDITEATDSISDYYFRWFDIDGDYLDDSLTYASNISNAQDFDVVFKLKLTDDTGCSSDFSEVLVKVSDNAEKAPQALSDVSLDFCIGDGRDLVLPEIDMTPSTTDSIDSFDLRWFKEGFEVAKSWSYMTNIPNDRASPNIFGVRLVDSIGCSSPESIVSVTVSGNPIADFEYGVSCDQTLWLDDQSMAFGEVIEDSDIINTWKWTILADSLERTEDLRDGDYDMLSVESGIHEVTLFVRSEVGCIDQITKDVTVFGGGIVNVNNVYLEDFQTTGGQWVSTGDYDDIATLGTGEDESSLLGNSSWAYEAVDNRAVIKASANNEYSWIESPCFDLNNWSDPKISMDMKYLTNELEGAVLQYRIKGETPIEDGNWLDLGVIDGGLNWFTSSSISAGPGGSITGWSGLSESVAGDGWITASYGLSSLQEAADDRAVQFRLAYASLDLPNESREGQGVFVDYISIEEKQRVNLVEHFTNLNDQSVTQERANVMELAAPSDVVYIQYHTLMPSADEFHNRYHFTEKTSNDHLSKGVIPGVTLVNGHGNSDESITSWGDLQYDYETLLSPAFDVTLNYDTDIVAGEPLQVTATAVRNSVSYAALDTTRLDLLMLLNVAVVQKENDSESGMQNNVLVKFLPEYGAANQWGTWYAGEGGEISLEATWDIPVDAAAGEFSLIAWIEQSSTTLYTDAPAMEEVYQVALMDIDMPLTATQIVLGGEEDLSGQLVVYPIPAKEELIVSSDPGLVLSEWKVTNLQGQVVISGLAPVGKLVIDLSDVSTGLYILGVQTNKGVMMTKFIKE